MKDLWIMVRALAISFERNVTQYMNMKLPFQYRAACQRSTYECQPPRLFP